MDIDVITKTSQLVGEQRELAEIVGLQAYRTLVKNYGGMHIYICKTDALLREFRNNEIYDSFNGANYRELAKKYNLSEKTVREIVAKKQLCNNAKISENN